ncbi:hypothetical protein JCM11641_008256 [Rhodosporidiobolus odoratus]
MLSTLTSSLPLPYLAFDASTLCLTAWNQPASTLLGRQWADGSLPLLSASDLLEQEPAGKAGSDEVGLRLERLARQSEGMVWGDCLVVEYYVEEAGRRSGKRADAVVGLDPDTAVYSLVFLRPAPAPVAPPQPPVRLGSDSASVTSVSSSHASISEPTYAPVFSPSSSTSSLSLLTPPQAVFSSSAPPSAHAAALANAGLVRTAAAAVALSSPAVSSGSGSSSASSASRRAPRTATGQERRKLPVAPEIGQMLAHAINTIRDRGPGHFAAASTALSPVPSSPEETPPSIPQPILGSPPLVTTPSFGSALPPSVALASSSTSLHASPSLSATHLSPTASPRLAPSTIPAGHAARIDDDAQTFGRRSSFDQRYDALWSRVAKNSNAPENYYRMPECENEALGLGSCALPPPTRRSPRLAARRTREPDHSSQVVKDAAKVLSSGVRRWEGKEEEALRAGGTEEQKDEGQSKQALEQAAEANGEPLPPDETDGLDGKQRRKPLSFEQLTNCVETAPHIMFIASAEGEVLWLNHEWFRYTGQDHTYLLDQQEWLSMFHPDDLPGAFAVYLGAMKNGQDFWFEYRIRGADGELRWHICQGRAHRDETGNIDNWYCTITNADALVTTRHDALLIKERTACVLEGSDLLLLTVDNAGLVTFAEGRRPSLFPEGRNPSEPLIGSSFCDLWPNTELNEAVRRVLDEEDDVVELETFTELTTGQRQYHRYRLVPLRGDPSIPSTHPDAIAVTGVIIVGRDVTQLVLAGEELERSRAEKAQLEASEFAAKEANRIKTEFLTTVSHEIRTPIASILGICELLLADDINDDQRMLVEKAVRSGENLLDLVGAVLDVRKVETGELVLEAAPFALSDALSDARLFSVIAQKKGLKFIEQIEDGFYEGVLLGDRLRLRQVLANALSNSVKFTSQGYVSLGLRQLQETKSSVTVEFTVEDSGVGIDKEVLPTLFVPFRQADASTARKFGGSGLGLTIAKKLIELMGGSVSLTSAGTHRGTRMTITVPLAKAPLLDVADFIGTPHPVPASSPNQARAIAEQGRRVDEVRKTRRPEDVRILLAEDNDLIREILIRTLRGRKFHIDAVEDGQQCLDQVEEQSYDVILMDGQMPNVDGYQATKAIRQHSSLRIRNLRIIALTASAIAGDKERCLQSGMSSYLAKPVRAKELEAAIWQQVELAEQHKPANRASRTD